MPAAGAAIRDEKQLTARVTASVRATHYNEQEEMAAFDPQGDERQIKRMKLDEVIDELRDRKEKDTGTEARLRSRLLDARARGAAAMDVDVGDELSPLSDTELLALVRKQSKPYMPRTGSRLDWITRLKARNVLDAHGRHDPRAWNAIIFETDIENHPDDDWWVCDKHPELVGDETIMVASTRGGAAPGGGTKHGVPVELAAHASRVLALAKVPLWKTDVWESAAAEPFRAEAKYILEKPAPIVEHGCNIRDAKGTRLERLTDGTVVARRFVSVDGVRWIHTVTVRTSRLAQLREAERVGARMRGVADAAASLAAEVLDDASRGRAALLALCRANEAAVLQKARAMNGKDAARVAALLRERDVDLSRRSTYAKVVGMVDDDDDNVPILEVEDRTPMHLINNPLAVLVWRRHASTGGRLGQDEQKNAIAEALRRPGWKIGDERTEMHNIIVAAMPYLKETRFRWVLDYLVSKAQIDHIFSGVTDHVSNLMVEFAGPNGHFSDFTNCPGKAARYGAEVMAVAAEWVRQAIEAALDIVSYSKESA